MLNSIEHEVNPAVLENVKMPLNVGIINFMSKINKRL